MFPKQLKRQIPLATTQLRNYVAKQHTQPSIKQWATETASTLNKKTGEILAEGIDVAQHLKHHSDAIHKVRVAERGYKNLKDKGEKVESEQCRPDDGL
ncbi:hypothetical protein KGF57_004622 [Candida theae]|uniref:Uncharacterized protein n=1 Tax=Candida theae TaxID=1198502 RepID=A0AAD5BBY0_9ASCO|nr:uncharacterized protein KGF57_004622 [Candida theae]KAI5949799.1 hypothetical protein KGF57_004622 [Candida theae]